VRVLVSANPHIGHTFPLVPLAWALRAAGHEVLVATSGDALAAGDSGLPVVDVGRGVSLVEAAREIEVRHADVIARLRARPAFDMSLTTVLFAHLSSYFADRTIAVGEAWRPDLVLYSQLWGAGLVTAAKLRVPAAAVHFGLGATAGLGRLVFESMAETRSRHAVDEPPSRTLDVVVTPPSMGGTRGAHLAMRHVPYNGGGVLPDWLLAPADGPRIAVTLGTVSPRRGGLGAVERVLVATQDVNASLVLALGDIDVSSLGALPDTVRDGRWLPLHVLLPSCDAIVHHGGAGTALAALAAGVPQLVMPDGADRAVAGEAVRARGCGLVARPEDVDAGLLRRLVSDTGLRAATAEVQAEIADMPAPAALAARLADLAGVPV